MESRSKASPLSKSSRGHPNDEAIQVWEEIVAPKYALFRRILARGLGAHGNAALSRHPVSAGERVVEIGCGLGERALDLAARTGPGGEVVGIDPTRSFLEIARAEAKLVGLEHLRYVEADVERSVDGESFDLAFSQFGTMFFANPTIALQNIRRALRSRGRLVMVVWRALEDNPVFAVPMAIAERHLPPRPREAATCGPGPFSMADPERVHPWLHQAGFEAVRFERVDLSVSIGQSVREAIDFLLSLGPAGERMRLAAGLKDERERRARIEDELEAALRPCFDSSGVHLSSSSWCVSARAGG